MVLLTFYGGPAFSQFHLHKKLAALRQAVPTLRAIHAEFVHFALVRSELSPDE